MLKLLPNGVMVARLPLEEKIGVRIPVRQPKLIMIYTFEKLLTLRLKLSNKKTVFVSGCFDLLHEGHLQFLKKATEFGDVLIVGVLSDRYIRTHKKREPIISQSHRAHIIDSLKYVDYVILTPYIKNIYPSLKILQTLKPKVFLRCEKIHMYKPIKQKLHNIGIILKTFPMKKINSTSKIIKKISKNLKLNKK